MISINDIISDSKNNIISESPSDELKQLQYEIQILHEHGLFDSVGNYINLVHNIEKIKKANYENMLSEIQLILSERCNLRCKYCYCSKQKLGETGKQMPVEIAYKCVDLLCRQMNPQKNITFFGGEPLLNKSTLLLTMEYAKKIELEKSTSINYSITTNATLLDDEIIEKIVNDNFGLLVSLDGPKALHDSQCIDVKGKGSFDMAARNIKELMKRRSVGVRATMTHPMPKLRELIHFFSRFWFFQHDYRCDYK